MGSLQKRQSSVRVSASDVPGTGFAARLCWRRWRRWLVAGLSLVAVGVVAAPMIVSRTPLAGLLLGRALTATGCRIDCRQVSLAWLSAQSLTGVTLTDSAGASLLDIDRVSVDRSLLELFTGRYRQGRLQLDRPVLQVAIRLEGSNVEDFIRGLRQTDWWPSESPDPAAPGSPHDWYVIVTKGKMQGADEATGAGWTVRGLELELRTASDQQADPGGGWQVTGSGRLLALVADAQSDRQQSGQGTTPPRAVTTGEVSAEGAPLQRDGQFKFRLHPDEAGRQQLEVVADRLTLSGIAPWLARFAPGIGLTGEVSLDGSITWWQSPAGPWAWQTSGQLKASRVEYRGEPLGDDRLRCERLEGGWQLASGQDALEIGQLDARTEWGELTARGALAWPGPGPEQGGARSGGVSHQSDQEAAAQGGQGSGAAGQNTAAVPSETHLRARLDMARLAAMLPGTLRIRSGVQVESGTLALTVRRVKQSVATHSAGCIWTARLVLEDLLAETELLRVDEPQVRLVGDFRWDRQAGQLASQNLECLTSTLAWRGRGLKLSTSKSGQAVVEGQVAFRMDIRRLAAALRLEVPPAAAGLTDMPATGQVQLRTDRGRLQAQVTLDYDWDTLAGFFDPEVRLHGTDRATFQVTGPEHGGQRSGQQPRAWSWRWQVTADAGWQSATVYGLPLGPARWQGALGAGQLRSEPLLVTVGQEGRLTVQPSMRLDPEPRLLIIPAGPLLSAVTLSPEVSENILKYVAPVLAGATRTTGTFSLHLDQGQIPLDAPSLAEVSGRLAISRLSVAPGPTTEQVVALVRQIEALAERRLPGSAKATGRRLITIDGRTIEFHLARGRVHHRGLEFLVDGVPVHSSGSVGLDQTLDVTIEVPILDQWVQRQRALQPLAGQVLTIPVRGTFQRPRIDQRVVADLSTRMLQGVAERALGDELNRQLEKLLRKNKK